MNPLRPFRRCLRALALAALASAALGAQAAELIVSGAASLADAFSAIGQAYEREHRGTKVHFNFAASDALLQQIARGAPVDVYAAADAETMDRAAARGLLAPGTRRDFAANRLVLITPRDTRPPLQTLAELQQAAVRRVALGDPASVPAGRYAQGALEAQQLWQVLQPKLILALSVRQSLDYVARGEVDAGFVYATDAALRKSQVQVAFTVPTATPIRYPIAALAASSQPQAARQFIDFVASPAGREILARYGFAAP